MRVNVHIDRVVIEGLSESPSGDELGTALRTELARLIAIAKPSPQAGSVSSVRTAPLSFADTLTAQTLSGSIAGSLYGALSPPARGENACGSTP